MNNLPIHITFSFKHFFIIHNINITKTSKNIINLTFFSLENEIHLNSYFLFCFKNVCDSISKDARFQIAYLQVPVSANQLPFEINKNVHVFHVF